MRCRDCNWSFHTVESHGDLCDEGLHALSVVGLYKRYGHRDRCLACMRAIWKGYNDKRAAQRIKHQQGALSQ